jgi:hypothetical protein
MTKELRAGGEAVAQQGATKGCRLSWLTNSALVYESKCGAGSQLMSTAACAHGAQINFGDLTPYLFYAVASLAHALSAAGLS